MVARICDRCGKHIDTACVESHLKPPSARIFYQQGPFKKEIVNGATRMIGEGKDISAELCTDCSNTFIDWFYGAEN